MEARDYLFYGFGQVVYCLAFSDGAIQPEERIKLDNIIHTHLEEDLGYNVTNIIFKLLNKQNDSITLQTGIKNMKLGDHHLNERIITAFKKILEDIAEAFPPSTKDEKEIISEFNKHF